MLPHRIGDLEKHSHRHTRYDLLPHRIGDLENN